MSFYSIGVTALSTAQLGLTTAGHNISNVNTDSYHRQTISQSTNIPVKTGAGFVGQGVHVDTIKRVYNQFLENQVLEAQTQSSHLGSYLTEIQQLDNMLGNVNAGLSPALQDFFSAVADVAASPQSVPSRQALLSKANAMVTRLHTLAARFTEIRDGVNTQIAENVTAINSYSQQISKINEQIVLQSGNGSQAPNDLLDQRDNLLSELNKHVRVTVLRQDDGSMNVFIGNGQPLVIGLQPFTLTATPSAEDQQRIGVGYMSGANNVPLPDSSMTGGSLGGLLEFRSEGLDEAQNALGRVAMGLARTFNDQHKLGQDLNGALGGNFFQEPAPTVLVSANNNPASGTLSAVLTNVAQLTTSDYRVQFDGTNYLVTDLVSKTTSTVAPGSLATAIPGLTLTAPVPVSAGDVFTVQPTRAAARDITLSTTINTTTVAAAAPMAVAAATSNGGDAKVIDSGVTSLAWSPFVAGVTMTYNSATSSFDLTGDVTASIPYTSGTAMTFNGLTVTMSGTPANGDVFTIGPNTGGVSDSRNMLLLAQLQTKNTMEGGTASFQGTYSQLVNLVGNKTSEVKVTGKAQDNMLEQVKSSQQAVSGVNLDEEAANLMRFQQAYQAAAKMMQIASTTFDALLQIGR